MPRDIDETTALKDSNSPKIHHSSTENLLPSYDDDDDDDKKIKKSSPTNGEGRQQWNNEIEFLLSLVSMSVGLGNVWRFPSVAYENGGGAFLVPYIIMVVCVGRPFFFMELHLGQFSSKNNVQVWDMAPIMRGIGFLQVIASFAVNTYYTSIIGVSVYYFFASFQSVLPWTVCDPNVVTDNNTICIDSHLSLSNDNNTTSDSFQNVISPAEQFLQDVVLKEKKTIEDGIGSPDPSLAGCLAFTYIILFFILLKGVHSSGKVAYFTAFFPYFVLIILLVRGLTLPGSTDGLLFFLVPKWEALSNISVWYSATTQLFYSLGCASGNVLTYSSYNNFNNKVYKDALIVSVVDTCTSLLAGLTIFGVLGYLAHELKVPVDEVVSSGMGLAFVSYPTAIGKFDVAPQIFSAMFFLMLFTLGIGSVMGHNMMYVSLICDACPHWNKILVTMFILIVGFFLSLIYTTPGGQHILTLIDFFGGSFLLLTSALLVILSVVMIYGLKNLIFDVKFMQDIVIGWYWKLSLGVVTPVVLICLYIIFLVEFPNLEYAGQPLPKSALDAGWCIFGIAVAQLPIWFVIELSKTDNTQNWQTRFKEILQPNKNWGPIDPVTKNKWEKQRESKTN